MNIPGSPADRRNQAVTEFLGLAGRVERLVAIDPLSIAKPSPTAFQQWMTVYGDEIAECLRRRKELIDRPQGVYLGRLTIWIEDTRKLLEPAEISGW